MRAASGDGRRGPRKCRVAGTPGSRAERTRPAAGLGPPRQQGSPTGPGCVAGPQRVSGGPPSPAPPRQPRVTCWSPGKNSALARLGGSAGRTARAGPAGNPAALPLRSPASHPPWPPCCSGSDTHRDPEAVGGRRHVNTSRFPTRRRPGTQAKAIAAYCPLPKSSSP